MGEARTVYDWEEAKVMLAESEHPIGVIVICADCKVKNKFVYSTLEKFSSSVCITGTGSTERVKAALKESAMVCISLTPQEASDHAKRHEAVTTMRMAGAKSVYGVYLRTAVAIFPEEQEAKRRLETDPPTADGLDGLIVL